MYECPKTKLLVIRLRFDRRDNLAEFFEAVLWDAMVTERNVKVYVPSCRCAATRAGIQCTKFRVATVEAKCKCHSLCPLTKVLQHRPKRSARCLNYRNCTKATVVASRRLQLQNTQYQLVVGH